MTTKQPATTITAKSTATAGSGAHYRVANVVIRPRSRAQLALSLADAGAHIQRNFGAVCASVSGVSTRDDSWSATVVVDASKAPASEAKLLLANLGDERLWKSFIEARYADGACDVIELESTSTLAVDAARPR